MAKPRTRTPAALANFRSRIAKTRAALPHAEILARRRVRDRSQRAARRRGSDPSMVARVTACTPDLAAAFVKILNAGVPALTAVAYCCPTANPESLKRTLETWARDPLVLAAIARLNGGEWHDLDKDTRIDLAIDKHLAELAHFLYANSYEKAEGLTLSKITEARRALTEWLAKDEAPATGAWQQMIQDLLDGKVQASGPPQLTEGTPVPPDEM